ncbi:MAG: RNA polymerase sigma factor rpoD [Flavobacteriales bacterium BRH_c54]|nr:MAG: RNA polymerase sigma factor rpoD [Flavobacteriales bacterium BRH_c54]
MRQLKITQQVTNRETISLEKYLQDISKLDMITADEEVELARKIKAGDMNALEKLVRANLRFVISVSKQYQNQGLTLPDLINEGNIGLIKAAERFDETRGFKFISYAVWWIRQSILQAIAEQARIVRLPLNKIGNISKINKAFTSLEQFHEREPSVEEIADLLDITTNEVSDFLKISGRHISVDAPLSDNEDSGSMLDLMSDENVLNSPDKELTNESLRSEIERSLSTLSPREATVLKMYYGIGYKNPLTLDEIGRSLDLTRERVRQIKEKSLRRLKQTSRSNLLRPFLG